MVKVLVFLYFLRHDIQCCSKSSENFEKLTVQYFIPVFMNIIYCAGIKVLLDLVPNHTSDEHKWFVDSINKKNGKEDYYVWVDPDKMSPAGFLPPNNWVSNHLF